MMVLVLDSLPFGVDDNLCIGSFPERKKRRNKRVDIVKGKDCYCHCGGGMLEWVHPTGLNILLYPNLL